MSMTDEQIIEALEYCVSTKSCEECPICNTDNCGFVLMRNAFDLIERQRAEIEDLREIIFTDRTEAIKKLKAEAIKEFAERLKKRLDRKHTIYGREYVLRHLRELVKEMTEEEGADNA